jgi:threonine synthase
VLRESNGTAVTVTDSEILEGVRLLAKTEGIFACPEGGATVAGLRRLLEQGWIDKDERVVVFNTGSGFKYLESFDVELEIAPRGFWRRQNKDGGGVME